jgi:hypothetical protein
MHRGEGTIARHQGGVERLSKRNVRRVVRSEVVAQLPNSRQQDFVRIAIEGDISVIFDDLSRPNSADN